MAPAITPFFCELFLRNLLSLLFTAGNVDQDIVQGFDDWLYVV